MPECLLIFVMFFMSKHNGELNFLYTILLRNFFKLNIHYTVLLEILFVVHSPGEWLIIRKKYFILHQSKWFHY